MQEESRHYSISPGHRLSGKLGPHHHPLFSNSVVSRHITHIWTRTEIHLNIQHKKYEAQWGHTLNVYSPYFGFEMLLGKL